MAYRPLTSGRNNNISEAISVLRQLRSTMNAKEAKTVMGNVHTKAFSEVRHAIYGSKYGISLAEIFSKTRARTASGRSTTRAGAGTPVKTGRLQKSLTNKDSEFSLYAEYFNRNTGEIMVNYGGNPVNPKTGAEYFDDVESKFKFFADGILKFDQGKTMGNLGEGLAYIFGKALQDHIKKSIKTAKR